MNLPIILVLSASSPALAQDPARLAIDKQLQRIDDIEQRFADECALADEIILAAIARNAAGGDDARRREAERDASAFQSNNEVPLSATAVATEYERLRREAFVKAISGFDRAADALRMVMLTDAAEEIDRRRATFCGLHDDCLWSDLLLAIAPEHDRASEFGSWTRDGRALVSNANERATRTLSLPANVADFELELLVERRQGAGSLELAFPVAGSRYSWMLSNSSLDDDDAKTLEAALELAALLARGPRTPIYWLTLSDDEPGKNTPLPLGRPTPIAVMVSGSWVRIEVNGIAFVDGEAAELLQQRDTVDSATASIVLAVPAESISALVAARLRVARIRDDGAKRPSGAGEAPTKARSAEARRAAAPTKPTALPRKSKPSELPSVGTRWQGKVKDGSMKRVRLHAVGDERVTFRLEGYFNGAIWEASGKLRGRTVSIDDLRRVRDPNGHHSIRVERPHGTITFLHSGGLTAHLKAKIHGGGKTTNWELDISNAESL